MQCFVIAHEKLEDICLELAVTDSNSELRLFECFADLHVLFEDHGVEVVSKSYHSLIFDLL